MFDKLAWKSVWWHKIWHKIGKFYLKYQQILNTIRFKFGEIGKFNKFTKLAFAVYGTFLIPHLHVCTTLEYHHTKVYSGHGL